MRKLIVGLAAAAVLTIGAAGIVLSPTSTEAKAKPTTTTVPTTTTSPAPPEPLNVRTANASRDVSAGVPFDLTVQCLSTERVTGGGWSFVSAEGGFAALSIIRSIPTNNESSWTILAVAPQNGSASVFAQCLEI